MDPPSLAPANGLIGSRRVSIARAGGYIPCTMTVPAPVPDDPNDGIWLEAIWGAALCGSILFFAAIFAMFLR
jgi:hypothetical protein